MTKCARNPLPLRDDRLDMPVEGDDLGLDPDLFLKLPRESLGERLADLDPAARQS